MSRMLTRAERQTIRRLVNALCANFDREQGCKLLLFSIE